MDAHSDVLDPSLTEVERQLAALRPAQLPAGMLDRLEAALVDARGAGEAGVPAGKVVEFPVRERRVWRPWWGAAAAVALGAGIALWVPAQRDPSAAVASHERPAAGAAVAPTVGDGKIVAAGYGRDVREASDEGIVLQGQVPHRRVRVVYMDRVVVTNAQGEKIEVERPRVEWLLIPEKMD